MFTMATLQELNEVVRETLENRGVLGQLRARVRAEVFSALNEPTDSRPEMSRENFLINELIREYLEFNHYKYTSSVLVAETGMSGQKLDRRFLAEQLNVAEDKSSSSVPLLYSIIGQFAARSRFQPPNEGAIGNR